MKKIIVLLVAFFCIPLLFANNDLQSNNPQSTIIYWDASSSQKEKDIHKEFDFLDAYFKTYPNSKVKLVVFNIRIISEESIEVTSANWDLLKQKLEQVVYDGASDFSLVNTELKEEMLLFFTDGNGNFGNFKASLYSPRIITISSKTAIDKKFLHKTAFYNRGYYVDLLESDISSAIQAIKEKTMMPRLEFVTKKNKDANKKYVEGIVTGETDVLPNVNIFVKDKNKGTITDQFGKYKIAVEPGDVLVFSKVNMKKAVIDVTEEDDIIQVKLTKAINELDPAIVKAKKSNKPNRGTIAGIDVNLDAIGYAVQSIDAEQMGNLTKLDIGESMAGKFAGVSMTGHNDNPGRILIRGWHSITLSSHPLFIVDGIPMPRSGRDLGQGADYSFIDNNTVEDITILKGISATNRYGSEGRNGVILVTTNAAGDKLLANDEKTLDKELKIKYKVFESALQVDNKQNSNFITMLKKYPDAQEAYSYYLSRFKFNKDNVSFFVECSDYFFQINEPELGIQTISNLAELFPENTSVLKILAFNLEKHQIYDKAQEIYRRIITIAPSISQTYLDLANTYFAGHKYQKSVDLFKRISSNRVKKIETFDGLESQITHDFKNLLANRNQTWKVKKIDPYYFSAITYDLRVVTEWSHPQTEFKLQYINSKKQYFTLSHTKEDNKKKLQDELKEGYTSDEYVLSDIEPGEWFLNIMVPDTYVPDIKDPKFIKVKVFTKYGSPDQKLQIHVINLDRVTKNNIFTSFRI